MYRTQISYKSKHGIVIRVDINNGKSRQQLKVKIPTWSFHSVFIFYSPWIFKGEVHWKTIFWEIKEEAVGIMEQF